MTGQVVNYNFRSQYGNVTVTLPVRAQVQYRSGGREIYIDGHRVIGMWAGSRRAPRRDRPQSGDWKLVDGKWYERRWRRDSITPNISALVVANGRPVFRWEPALDFHDWLKS